MASRYERIFLLKDISNPVDAPVEVLAGALLLDQLSGKIQVQLKLRVVDDNEYSEIIYRFKGYNGEGQLIRDCMLSYDGGFSKSDGDFGTDILIGIPETTITSFEVELLDAIVIKNEYDVTVQLSTQKFPLYSSMIIAVDDLEPVVHKKGESKTYTLPVGNHVIHAKYSWRKKDFCIDVERDTMFVVSFNNISGDLQIKEC